MTTLSFSRRFLIAAAAGATLLGHAAFASDSHRTPAPAGAEVYFIQPQAGESLSSPVIVKFGLRGMGVAPAGVEKEKTGHHHLLIDIDLEDYDSPIPADENHRHFGGGQTETSVELPPGTHTLQLLVGDHNHIPHQAPVQSEKITITVK